MSLKFVTNEFDLESASSAVFNKLDETKSTTKDQKVYKSHAHKLTRKRKNDTNIPTETSRYVQSSSSHQYDNSSLADNFEDMPTLQYDSESDTDSENDNIPTSTAVLDETKSTTKDQKVPNYTLISQLVIFW